MWNVPPRCCNGSRTCNGGLTAGSRAVMATGTRRPDRFVASAVADRGRRSRRAGLRPSSDGDGPGVEGAGVVRVVVLDAELPGPVGRLAGQVRGVGGGHVGGAVRAVRRFQN